MGRSYREVLGLVVMVVLLLDLGSAQSTPRTIVKPALFNGLLAAVPKTCEGKTFYNYNAFISAAESFTGFGTTGTVEVRKREMAAFLANVMHETRSLCYIKEIRPPSIYCDRRFTQYPCKPRKSYYGRGPLQLTWNYNYGGAGRYLRLDLLSNPDLVAQNPTVAFKTALWFWMINRNCHKGITTGGGFGSTIRAINGGECGGKQPKAVASRVAFYYKFCKQFGVTPGSNVSC